jgi:hypothetical protein
MPAANEMRRKRRDPEGIVIFPPKKWMAATARPRPSAIRID